jgi:competence protein ComEA
VARDSHWAGLMAPWNAKPLLPTLSPTLSPHRSRSRCGSLVARFRESTWLPIAARAFAVLVALIVLGWIGRTAAAGPTSPMSVAAIDRDASASAPALPPLDPTDAGPPIVVSVATAATMATSGSPPATTGPAGSAGRASPSEPVYLNHASVDELRRLPGVGPKRAEAILVLRQRLGRFQRVEDLLRVKGVGRGAVKKWRPLVRLDSPAPPDAGSP